MTFSTKADLESAKHRAQWDCVMAMRELAHSDGLNALALSRAAFAAGQAWAYYMTSDITDKAFTRPKKGAAEVP